MRIFGIKIGYILIILALLFFGIRAIFDDSKEIKQYTKTINSILDDIKFHNYFALQDKFSNNLKQNISIEDIKNYSTQLKLKSDIKFLFKDYQKDKSLLIIKGIVVNKPQKLPLLANFLDVNNTLFLNSLKIGKYELKYKKYSFPISKN